MSNTEALLPANSEIYLYLQQYHTGRARPIKAHDLAVRFNMSLRGINDEIRLLRKSGVIIGALRGDPAGYYIPANINEANEAVKEQTQETLDLLRTLNRQKRSLKTFRDSFLYTDMFGQREDIYRRTLAMHPS